VLSASISEVSILSLIYALNYCVKCMLRFQDSGFASIAVSFLRVSVGFLVKEGLYVLLRVGSTVNEVGK
jgi:hypothetical protein